MDVKARIKKQERILRGIFTNIPPDLYKVVDGLIQNAAFMKINLEDLQADIIERGAYITDMSGNGFEITKENPSQKTYSTMISKYSVVIKQLCDLLPDDGSNPGLDLLEFVKK